MILSLRRSLISQDQALILVILNKNLAKMLKPSQSVKEPKTITGMTVPAQVNMSPVTTFKSLPHPLTRYP